MFQSFRLHHKYFKPFPILYITCLLVMPPNLVYVILTLSVILILCPQVSVAAGTWVCKGCRNNAECDKKPEDFCPYGEVRDACNRRVCAKGPGERCGGFMNVLGQCGESMMCKSDERCHGCFLETMECYNEI
ncbi:unnamed protein product [Phaedon cochleariae]|uniref:Neuroparsin-A n=1 Tax=Phaedon cochleariae TaxID=80249 RepID=A0A9P0DVV8_PHACE|nr:unnamed protein product [Phaedon cochleariae]